MNTSDFEKKLDEIEQSFALFLEQFESGESSDFAPVYHQVVTLLGAAKGINLPSDCLERLQKLGSQLEAITREVKQEMKKIESEISDSHKRSHGHRVYKRQNYMER